MQKSFQKLSTLSKLFREARMPEMAGPETPQEAEQPRKLPPDAPLGKKKEGDELFRSAMETMEQADRNEEAERTLKDAAKTEKLVNFMLMMLTEKNPEQRNSLGFKEKAKDIARLVQDPKFHDLFVDCAITREHGDDSQRRESASALVNALAQNGAMEQTFVAQLEKTKVVGSQPTMLAGGRKARK